MADFKELIDTVTDEATKTALIEAYDKVNKERGEFGQKLILKDKEIGELKGSSVEYKKAFKILQDSGTKAEDIPKLLEKLSVTKTLQDEYELTKTLLKDKTNEVQTTAQELDRMKKERAVEKKLEKAKAEFKDSNGKPVKLADDFLDLEKLYSGITDLSNEAVLNEKIQLALKEGLDKQTSILGKIGFQGAVVHKSQDGSQKNLSEEDLQKEAQEISKKYGPAAAITYLRKAQNKG